MGCNVSSMAAKISKPMDANGNPHHPNHHQNGGGHPADVPPTPPPAQQIGPKTATREWSFPSVVRHPHFRRSFGSPPTAADLRRDSFIHAMLRPQLDPSVPPIGVGGERRRVTGGDDDLMDTVSVEMCLARVISLRDQQHNYQHHHQVYQQQQPSSQPSISSANSDQMLSFGGPGSDMNATISRQWICGTAVTFEWLFQRLVEKFKCPGESEPQWIVEKLNEIGDKDLDRTTVLRITFGWENAHLPKSVVLKISETHDDDPPEEAKLGMALFKRECQCYEWLSKHQQRRIAIPRIFVIKKQWSKSCNALLVMEDLSDRAQTGELHQGISQEEIRDLLRNLAQLHSLSMVDAEGWRQALGGAKQPTFMYSQIERYARMVLRNASGKLDVDKLRSIESLMQSANLERAVKEGCAEMGLPECLLHGLPFSRNVFFKVDHHNGGDGTTVDVDEGRAAAAGGGRSSLVALIDWTQSHCGCIGEDLAKCICWNLDKKDRTEPILLRLLQYYHYQLLKKLQFYGANSEIQKKITLDQITDAYERFVPLAAVTFLLFLPEDLNHADGIVLERAQQLVEEAAEMLSREKLEKLEEEKEKKENGTIS